MKYITVGKMFILSVLLMLICLGSTGEVQAELIIPYGVTAIEEEAFYGDTSVTSVILPDSVESIGDRAFACTGLTHIQLSSGLTYISPTAFEGIEYLEVVTQDDTWADVWWEDNKGNFGHEANTPAEDFSYSELADGTVQIDDYRNRFWNPSPNLDVIIPKYINGKRVTAVGSNAFAWGSYPTSVTIPNSVTSIGDSAFSACSGLQSITIGNGVASIGNSAFSGCSNLISVTIPDSVTSIGSGAFSGCRSLRGITLPDGVINISESTFNNCINLTQLRFQGNINTIGKFAFSNCSSITSIILPDSLTSIDNRAFYSCTGLTNVTIPGNLTTINGSVFEGCTSIQQYNVSPENSAYCDIDGVVYSKDQTTIVMYPAGKMGEYPILSEVTYIGDYAFAGCEKLTSVSLPDSVTSIGANAFNGCIGLESVTIPDSVISIGVGAFNNCGYFITHIVPDCYAYQYCLDNHLLNDPLPEGVSLTQLGDRSYSISGFSGSCVNMQLPNYYHGYPVVEIAQGAFSGADISGTLTLPSMLKKIWNDAFLNCYNLTGELYLPDSVDYLGQQAFRECKNFTTLRLSPNIEIIEGGAFYGCTGFTGELILPKKLREIHEGWKDWIGVDHVGAFEKCTGFTGSLIIPDSVTRIELRAFQDCTGFNGSLQLGNSLQHIGGGAFLRCSNFTGSLIIPDSVTNIDGHAFYRCSGFNGDLQLSSNLTLIKDYAFYSCSGFSGHLTIPNKITRINCCAFMNCSHLTGLTLSETLASIGDSAFMGCSGFTGTLVLPQSLKTLENASGRGWNNTDLADIYLYGVFWGCSGFNSLVLPEGIVFIGNGAFSGCRGLRGDLIIPASVETVGSSAFADCGFDGCLQLSSTITTYGSSAFSGCAGLSGSLVIPSCVTCINSSTFLNCSGFSELVLPDSLTFIGDHAFEGCSGFRGTLNIPSAIETIDWRAFWECSGFEKLILNEGLITIGKIAFAGCSGLTGSLHFPDTVTSIGWHAFRDCNNLRDTIYFGSGLQSLGVGGGWGIGTAGIIGAANAKKIIFATKNLSYLDDCHYELDNAIIYCYPDTDTALMLESRGIAFHDLSIQTSYDGSLFSDLHLHLTKNKVETGEMFLTYVSRNDTNDMKEFRFEVWKEGTLVAEKDWSLTDEAAFTLDNEGLYTVKCYARLGELIYELYPYNVSVIFVPHIDEPTEEVVVQYREEAREHMISLLHGVLPPESVICVLKDKDVSGFDRLLLVAEDVVNFKLSDLMIPYNKTKFLFNDALARSVKEEKNIKIAKAELLPDAVKQLGQVSKIEVHHVQNALYSMCSQDVLGTFSNNGYALVNAGIKDFVDDNVSEIGMQNLFLSWGVSDTEIEGVMNNLKWLKDLHTISDIMSTISSAEKIVNSAIDVYNQIALMSVMDFDELSALARIYLESDDPEMKLVGTTLLTYCYSSYQECVCMITYGKLVDIGMSELLSSVASELVASASETFLLTVKITNTIINIWSGASEIPKYIFEIGFAADAVRGNYQVLLSRYREYLVNLTDEDDEALESACIAYIKYMETCVAAEASYQKLYVELYKKPITHALIDADQELLLTIDFSKQNQDAMKIMEKAMKVRLDFYKGGTFRDYISGLIELKNMISSH